MEKIRASFSVSYFKKYYYKIYFTFCSSSKPARTIDKMNPIFNKEGYNSRALENQKIMDLADMFVEFLEYEDENATVSTRYWTISTPSFKALNTLDATSFSTITGQDTTIHISKDNFKKLVRKKLKLSAGEPLKWRSGDEYYSYEDSEASAGLSVSLRYVIPEKKNKKNYYTS